MPIIQMLDKSLAPSKMQALRFGLWIGMASIIMLFGAITSSYLVRKPVGNWYEFKLPIEFFYSTIILVLSSVFMEMAYRNIKKGLEIQYKRNITITLITGILFIVMQVTAWKVLFAQGLTIDLNVSVSFLYLISGVHALHVIGGITVLIVAYILAYSIKFHNSSERVLKIDLVRQYWHFVDVLWIYLLVFLILQ